MKSEIEVKQNLIAVLQKKNTNYQRLLELATDLIEYDVENLRFRTDAGTLSHLGKDSIKDHSTAIIELVKNGYDADAEEVFIEINFNEKNNEKSSIKIVDNGHGMSEDDVIKKWLRIGYSEKRIHKKTNKDRRKTGEKGIGRLSADRLGKSLHLSTKIDTGESTSIKLDWSNFEKQGIDLLLIPFKKINSSEIIFPKKLKSPESGTELIITRLRNEWYASDLAKLYEELSILVSPFKNKDDFKIYLKSNITNEFNGLVKTKKHLKPEVHIELIYDGESNEITYILKDKYNFSDEVEKKISWQQLIQRPQKAKSVILKDIKNNDVTQDKPKCGPVMIDLMFYPRDKAMVKNSGFNLDQLKEYLSYNGGIKIYRDEISVKPYGFSGKDGEDWLNLGERQGQNPAGISRESWTVKNNQMLGAVYIGRDDNPDLSDSAAREGLVHNEAYYDLRALTLCGVRLLELHRHKIHKELSPNKESEKKSNKEQLEEYKEELQILKDRLKKVQTEKASDNTKENFENAFKQAETVYNQTDEAKKSIDEILDKNRTLGGLATLGIASAVFGHETQQSLASFQAAIHDALSKVDDDPININDIKIDILEAIEHSDTVAQWGAFALSRIKRDKRTRKKVKVHEIVDRVVRDIKMNFDVLHIDLTSTLQEVEVRTFPMDVETILINLLTNAYSATLMTTENRKVKVSLVSKELDEKKGFSIIVSDSGPGVADAYKEEIWRALVSTKTDLSGNESGTGLGLTIIQSIVDDLKGKRSIENDDNLGGAKFEIWIPS